MGQNQFMPSTYLGYAVDFDGDGHRDIWRSLPDVFASMANYLDQLGLGRPLHLGPRGHVPPTARREPRRPRPPRPLATWEQRGVRLPDGAGLPAAPIQASLLRMDDGAGPSYLVYGNFRALMAWNRSTYFGVSVGLLSDSLKDG